MTKEKVFEVLMQGDSREISSVSEKLKVNIPYTVIKKPSQELIMFQAEESVEKIDFNVGEVLITSAEVRVGDSIGWSMIMSMDEDRALNCAFLMGVYEADLPQKKTVEELACRLLRKMENDLRKEREIVSSTRVNFEIMGGQDPNVSHNNPREI
jgi:phosphonate C-P lyase system protein PhnG